MRQLLIDELQKPEMERLTASLARCTTPGPIEGLFWLPVPQDLLAKTQLEHQDCGPFHFAIDLGEDSIRFEMLVRAKATLHCNCTAYATSGQRDFLLNFVDRLLREEDIRA